ncbi:hypothetical protein KI387_032899, partial [Taxus chinensis]
EGDEKVPSFSSIFFTPAQSKKGISVQIVAAKDKKKNKEYCPPEVTQNKIINRGSPLPPSMESAKEHATIP